MIISIFMSVSYCLFLCITLRALDILSDEVLVELSAAYRRTVSHPVPLFAYCAFFFYLCCIHFPQMQHVPQLD